MTGCLTGKRNRSGQASGYFSVPKQLLCSTKPIKMKKLMIFLVTLIGTGSAAAQIEKGSWMLSASSNLGFASYTPTGSSGSSETLFNVGIKAGHFVAPNFALGLNLEYLNTSSSGPTSTITTFGVFARYYASKVFFGAGYNSISQSYGSSSSSSAGSIPIELGIAAFITRNIAVEPALVYTLATDSDAGSMPGYAGLPFSAKSAIALRVGFTLYLGRPAE